MTFAPPTIKDLAALWVANKGVNLGIRGDTSHITRGWSYHLGKDDLADGASSARLPRDVAGLSNAASALDLGRLDGTLTNLRTFSKWLVLQGQSKAAGTRDIREVIYSPDGKVVLKWDRERGPASKPIQLDPTPLNLGHRTHTHISFYRDSEFRDKTALFEPYFAPDITGDDMGLNVTDLEPFAGTVTVAKAGVSAIRVADGVRLPLPTGNVKEAFYKGRLDPPLDALAGDRATVYGIGGTQAVLLASDVKATPVVVPVPNCDKAVSAALDKLTAPLSALVTAVEEARK